MIGENDLNDISATWWRAQCGIVMQEGFIFSDTIERNIITGDTLADAAKLKEASEVSCIQEFVEELPFQFNTKVGASGVGLSAGQKQRLLIARAVYKNPEFFLFDEATSALDANNERKIIDQLNKTLSGKTAIIIAHRLSTVKNADQILVLEGGKIVEAGNHKSLTDLKGYYYNLIKNQLELGS